MQEKTQQGLTHEEIKGIAEALIFAAERPLSVKELKDIIDIEDARIIRQIVDEIKAEYLQAGRSFKLIELAGGFQFATDPVYAKWLKKLYNIKGGDYLRGPSLETLSIIAYKQPITKAEIEFIRGVNVDGVLKNLLEKGLIRVAGRKKVIGSPFLYATTREFLQYFGLNSLEDLPQLPEFTEKDIELGDEMMVENTQEQPAEPGPDIKAKNGGIENDAGKDTSEN
ncbi:MAG: SMC-Scp complex subunit ScpB [Candidatus Omnitrophota bacterium]